MVPTELLHLVLAPIARKALKEYFEPEVAEDVINRAFADYTLHLADVPEEPTWGGRLMVHLAALTAALYARILDRVGDEPESRRITAALTWAAYEKMATLPGLVANLGDKDPLHKLRRATAFFRRVPFSPPSYIMEDVDAGEDVVAFDVKRCPVAEFFRARGLSQLCIESWCDLDFPLARKWGGWLEREHTIAGGADRCDFRWHAGDPPADTDTEAL